jgi:hypothetical protein
MYNVPFKPRLNQYQGSGGGKIQILKFALYFKGAANCLCLYRQVARDLTHLLLIAEHWERID